MMDSHWQPFTAPAVHACKLIFCKLEVLWDWKALLEMEKLI